MKMKAAMLHGPKEFRIEEVDAPQMDERGVLIKIRACGVCPSDVRFYTGARQGATYPRRVGHEWVGEVIDTGSEVTEYKAGDRVAAYVQRVCGMCRNCQRGLFNMCTNRLPSVQGGFCEIGVAVPEALELIPDGVSWERAAFTEPLACCYNGIMRTPIKPGDSVVLVGVGPIGQILSQLAQLRGGRVIAIDMDPERLAFAEKMGASASVLASDADAVQKVMDLTGGYGADHAIVAVGSPKAEETVFDYVGQGASVNYFAGTYPPAKVAIDPNVIHYKQLLVTGSFHFTPGGFRTALDLITREAIQVEPLISHRLPLEDTAEGFDAVIGRKGLKVMIHMNGE